MIGNEEEPLKGFNTTPPPDLAERMGLNSETPPAPEQTGTPEATPPAESTQPPQSGTTTTEPPKGDEFIEGFNKRFGTAYKADDEIKALFDAPKKISEYEEKLKDYDALKSQSESYKKELEETKNQGYSEFLSKPLILKAYVADKLLEKYPDKDPFILQEIAMSDVDKMDDLDVVANEMKLRLPKKSITDLKKYIVSELGVDAETPRDQWDSMADIKLAERATNARERIKELTKGVEIPKFQTKEERQTLYEQALAKKQELIKPIKEKFTQFDEYVNGDFKFAVPQDFKAKLDGVFQGLFVDAGLEVNEENLAVAEMFKKSMFLEEYFPRIKEVIEKQAKTVIQEKTDEELHNTTPPNTATATDQGQKEVLPGLDKFFQDEKSNRATKL